MPSRRLNPDTSTGDPKDLIEIGFANFTHILRLVNPFML